MGITQRAYTDHMRRGAWIFVCLVALCALVGCGVTTFVDDAATGETLVRVPADRPTIQEAVDAVALGGLVLVSSGVYEESVTVATADVTVRGEDRNDVIIDAEGLRPHGIVAIADGVTIQNVTVTGATFYGVLVTGLHDENGPSAHGVGGYETLDPEAFPPIQRFRIDHVTAYNNGLYGIYAFNAQHGVIENSYASGSADSGFYVGQCENCDILVTGNTSERNAIGFEDANASDSLVVVGNRFSGNRVGATFISNYQEAFVPQRGATVIGNVITDNTSSDSPAHALGGYGTGVGLSGSVANHVTRNLITGNPRAGVLVSNTEDLAATDNDLRGNKFAANGTDIADVAASRAPSTGTCADGGLVTTPAELAGALNAACAATPGEAQPAATADLLPVVDVPAGVSFLRVAAPIDQPTWAGELESIPDPLPSHVSFPVLDDIVVPPADLLMETSGTQ